MKHWINQCPNCGFESPYTMAFCGMCGTRLLIACPQCEWGNPPSYRFCGRCGSLLDAAAPPRPAAVDALTRALEKEPSPPESIRLEGERRQVTVLIADVKGSTSLLEQIGTESWVEMMNRVLRLLENEIYRYGGQVDQFRGDGLVAFFGAAVAHEDDPERAVLAALSMQEALKMYAADLARERGIELAMRVGLNSGEVIIASIGDRSTHREDTAMGEAIAIAARIEAAAEPGTVLVSENTYHLTTAQFNWLPLGQISVRGLSRPLAVYRPLSRRADVELLPRRSTLTQAGPLIGRDQEFQIFSQCVRDLFDGRGSIVMLTGDGGMGKSFLVSAVKQLVFDASPQSPPPYAGRTWLQVRCRSYDESRPYAVWNSFLRRWLDMRENEPADETQERLQQRCQNLWGERWSEHYPYLAALLALPLDDAQTAMVRSLTAEGLHQRFFATLHAWLQAIARQGPFVLVFGDMQWIDVTSLDVVSRSLSLCENETLLWVLVFRLERSSPIWKFRYQVETEYMHRLTALTLSPLTVQQSSEIIDRLMGPGVLPPDIRQMVIDKAEGNPYYIEQFIQSLIRKGVLTQDARTGQWRAVGTVASLDLPESLQSALLARINGLSAEERHVLQVAAVIGSVFWFNVLHHLVNNPERLREHLTALQRAQLIYEGGRVPVLEKEYIFKSTLICDTVYESILSAQRAAYHRQVAECLVSLLGTENLSPYTGLIAYHYRRAQDHPAELRHTLAAAAQAQSVYANDEALRHYTRVLELLDTLTAAGNDLHQPVPGLDLSPAACRLIALKGAGQVSFGLGQLSQAEQYLRQAIDLGHEINLPVPDRVRLYYWLGEVLHWQDRYNDQIAIGEQGLALLSDDQESFEVALMNQEIASGYNQQGNRALFGEFTARTMHFIHRLPYAEELRPAFIHIALMYLYQQKNVPQSLEWLDTLEQKAGPHYDLRALGEVYLYRGEISARTGNLRLAIEQQQQSLQILNRIHEVNYKSWCLAIMGRTWLALGDLEQAEKYARMGLETAQHAGVKRFIKSAHWSLARIFICQKQHEQAAQALQHVAELSRDTQDPYGLMWSAFALGRVALLRGDVTAALTQWQQAIDMIPPRPTEQQMLDMIALMSDLDALSERDQRFLPLYQAMRLKTQTDPILVAGAWAPLSPDQVRQWSIDERFITQPAGWTWLDPLGDCAASFENGLTIRAANGRDLWHINLSAPRLLRPLNSGDWVTQTLCHPVSPQVPAIGGLLLWQDADHYLRLGIGRWRHLGIVFLMSCQDGHDAMIGRGRLPMDRGGATRLRLEKKGDQVQALCSTDGEQWFSVGQTQWNSGVPTSGVPTGGVPTGGVPTGGVPTGGVPTGGVPTGGVPTGGVPTGGVPTAQIGLHAVGHIDRTIYTGAFADGTAIRFESFQLAQGSF